MAVIKSLEMFSRLAFFLINLCSCFPNHQWYKCWCSRSCSSKCCTEKLYLLPKLLKCWFSYVRSLRSNIVVSVMCLSLEWFCVLWLLKRVWHLKYHLKQKLWVRVDFPVGVTARWFCPAFVLFCCGEEIGVCMINFFQGTLRCKSYSGWKENGMVCTPEFFPKELPRRI